ncbi:MAG: UvrD-helicase domain-containing protein [Acidobacteriota bacterium]
MNASASPHLNPDQLLAQDRAARRAAQLEFHRPLVLEAGAGTGKTTTLVARILAWSLGPGWQRHHQRLIEGGDSPQPAEIAAAVLRGVVAITFTEAAATEMATRVGEVLARLATGEKIPWLEPEVLNEQTPQRAQALAGVLDHLTVRTIHAFCRSLLAEFPLEARLHPRLEVDADGTLVEDLVRETVESHLARAYGEPGDDDFLALAALEIGPQRIADAVRRFANGGLDPRVLEEDPFGGRRLATLATTLEENLLPLQDELRALTGAKRAKKAVVTAEALLALIDEWATLGPALRRGEAQSLELLIAHPAFGESPLARLREWAKGRFGKAEEAALESSAADFASRCAALSPLLAHLQKLDLQRLHHGRRVVAQLLQEVRQQLRARGIVTFTDLLVLARDLMVKNGSVRRRVRARIDQLLVDEFQDTDPVQCEFLGALALDASSLEGSVQGEAVQGELLLGESAPKAATPGLFLVGDPKQSIYGWRSADLAAYDAFLQRVRNRGGEVLRLVENFRSVPAILQEVQRCVAPVMVEEFGVQPKFQPLLACESRAREEGFHRGRWRPVEHWVSWPAVAEEASSQAQVQSFASREEAASWVKGSSSAAATALEALALARDLLRLRQEGVAWGDVGILLRSGGDLDVYLDALRAAHIPFAVGRDKQYFRRREIIDAAALVRSVLDPGDTLALLTFLRCVAVGVPDSALLPLWRRGLPAALAVDDEEQALAAAEAAAKEAPRDIPGIDRIADWPRALAEAIRRLLFLRRLYRDGDAHRWVSALRSLLPLELLESARYMGTYRRANLQRFFRQLRDALDEGSDTPGLLRLLRRSVAESLEAEEGRPKDADGDSVQVLTIHSAKGLDFRHVYLLQLHKRSQRDRLPDVDFSDLSANQPKVGDAALTAPNNAPDRAIAARSRSSVEYVLFGAPTLGWVEVQAQRRTREAAERVRLLYVALTRPKDRLVTLGAWPGQPKADVLPAEAAESLLDLLQHRAAEVDLLSHFAGSSPPLEASGGEASGGKASGGKASGGKASRDVLDVAEVRWSFPGLDLEEAEALPAPPEAPPQDSVQALQHFWSLRAQATRRQQRPWSQTASSAAHAHSEEHGYEEQQAEPQAAASQSSAEYAPAQRREERAEHLERAERQGQASSPRGFEGAELWARRAAMAAGTAVHRCLEDLPLHLEDLTLSDLQLALEEEEGKLPQLLRLAGLTGPTLEAAEHRASSLLRGMQGGQLLERLRRCAPGILARELPLLLPANNALEDAVTKEDPLAPVGYLIGSADLVYRDPENGELVVADYKTDSPEGLAALPGEARASMDEGGAGLSPGELEPWLEERARHYAPQGEIYRRAVADALGEGERTRFELWFLALDRAVELA